MIRRISMKRFAAVSLGLTWKRSFVFLLCLLLLFLLLLPCGALSLVTHTRLTYLGYQALIAGEEYDAPWNFIHYQQIRSLGSFRVFYCIPALQSYSYTLKDSANCYLELSVSHYTHPDDFVPDATYTVSDLAEDGDFRLLSFDAVAENDHGGRTRGIIEYENIQYRYYDEELYGIVWVWNGVHFQLSATSPRESIYVTENYPIDRNTVMAKLLKSETAADALHALQGAMEKSAARYRIEAIRTRRNVSLIVIGAATVAVVTWRITYLVMRKKLENAYRLAGNGEIPVSAGEAIASAEDAPPPDGAPDSTPTPPEETPPNTPTE